MRWATLYKFNNWMRYHACAAIECIQRIEVCASLAANIVAALKTRPAFCDRLKFKKLRTCALSEYMRFTNILQLLLTYSKAGLWQTPAYYQRTALYHPLLRTGP